MTKTTGPDAYSTAGMGSDLNPYPAGTTTLDEETVPDGDGDKVDTYFGDSSGVQTIPPGDYQTDTPSVPDASRLNSAEVQAPFRQTVGGVLEDGNYSGSPGSGNDDGEPPRHYTFRIDDQLGSGIGEGLGAMPDAYVDPHNGSET